RSRVSARACGPSGRARRARGWSIGCSARRRRSRSSRRISRRSTKRGSAPGRPAIAPSTSGERTRSSVPHGLGEVGPRRIVVCYAMVAMTDFRRFQGTERYLTDPALEAAVNCALALERPLLIKGEPGTGKTLLATAVAEALG